MEITVNPKCIASALPMKPFDSRVPPCGVLQRHCFGGLHCPPDTSHHVMEQEEDAGGYSARHFHRREWELPLRMSKYVNVRRYSARYSVDGAPMTGIVCWEKHHRTHQTFEPFITLHSPLYRSSLMHDSLLTQVRYSHDGSTEAEVRRTQGSVPFGTKYMVFIHL